jgi:hypothetical protein
MQDVIAWLESPEGERWSYWRHVLSVECNRVIGLIMVKDDAPDFQESVLWAA